MTDFATFGAAVLRGTSFGADAPASHDGRPIGVMLADLDNRIEVFDAWAFKAQGGPGEGTLGPSYWEGWSRFVSADPPTLSATRPSGWLTFHANIIASAADLELWDAEPPVRAMTESFEREFVRYYDMAIAGGGDPPAVGLPAAGPEEPGATPLEQSADFSVGVMFLLAGAALYIAGRRK